MSTPRKKVANAKMSSSSSMTSSFSNVSGGADGVDDDMADINALLYLEVLKRFKEDETNINRQVEAMVHQYTSVRKEYLDAYAKYARFVKLLLMRRTLDEHKTVLQAADELATTVDADIASVMKITENREVCDYVPREVLQQCKEKLKNCQQHNELAQQRREHDEVKSLVSSIQMSEQALENMIETVTMQSLDHFIDHIQIEE